MLGSLASRGRYQDTIDRSKANAALGDLKSIDNLEATGDLTATEARALRDGFSNKRILNNGDVTVGGYKNISLDVEKGGSGKVNIHLQVDGKKYFYDSKTGTYTSKDGASLPSSIARNPKIQIATKKAREYGKKIQGK